MEPFRRRFVKQARVAPPVPDFADRVTGGPQAQYHAVRFGRRPAAGAVRTAAVSPYEFTVRETLKKTS
ncbi:hypothetical protein QZM01_25180 [Burkholderia multivorans]|nr:hypothetical protein [Burkholderia multivorans]